jgi:hypothetical protein
MIDCAGQPALRHGSNDRAAVLELAPGLIIDFYSTEWAENIFQRHNICPLHLGWVDRFLDLPIPYSRASE